MKIQKCICGMKGYCVSFDRGDGPVHYIRCNKALACWTGSIEGTKEAAIEKWNFVMKAARKAEKKKARKKDQQPLAIENCSCGCTAPDTCLMKADSRFFHYVSCPICHNRGITWLTETKAIKSWNKQVRGENYSG